MCHALKPTELTGEGSIPSGLSGYKSQPIVSLRTTAEMSAGIKYNKEVTMKTGEQKQTTETSVRMRIRVTLRFGIIAALVAGGLLVAPSA